MLRLLTAAVAVAALAVPAVHAWGAEGHEVIAAIAANLLTPAANTALKTWALEPGTEGDFTLVSVVNQPDQFDHQNGGRWSEALHFLNMGDNRTHVVQSRDCPPSEPCVIDAIQNFTMLVSKGPAAAPWNWTVEPSPVSFVAHLVGDCHQPLHVAYLGDRGGLYQDVKFFVDEHISDLHSVWDRGMIEYYQDEWYDLADDLMDVIKSNSSIVDIYTKDMTPAGWANESFQRTRSWVYNVSPGDRGDIPNDWGQSVSDRDYFFAKLRHMMDVTLREGTFVNADAMPLIDDSPWKWERDAVFDDVTARSYNQSSFVIGKNYYYRQMPVVFERLMAAGIRLGTLLNSALTGGSADDGELLRTILERK